MQASHRLLRIAKLMLVLWVRLRGWHEPRDGLAMFEDSHRFSGLLHFI